MNIGPFGDITNIGFDIGRYYMVNMPQNLIQYCGYI